LVGRQHGVGGRPSRDAPLELLLNLVQGVEGVLLLPGRRVAAPEVEQRVEVLLVDVNGSQEAALGGRPVRLARVGEPHVVQKARVVWLSPLQRGVVLQRLREAPQGQQAVAAVVQGGPVLGVCRQAHSEVLEGQVVLALQKVGSRPVEAG
jgi:hypothetical protein